MGLNLYLIRYGKLKRKDNTIYIKSKRETKAFPVKKIDSIFCFGEFGFNSKVLAFLTQHKIPIHFFNYHGWYIGSFYPREYLNSGFLLIKQAEHYLNEEKRLLIAREILKGGLNGMLKNLRRYEKKNEEVKRIVQRIELYKEQIEKVISISELLGIEGMCRNLYYQAFSYILRSSFKFEKRTKQPPANEVNALISFGNSLVYALCVNEIYHTPLNPTISYLHEPSERRFSLSLDLAEIFKPLISDRLIFRLVNNQIIKKTHFENKLNCCYLNEKGKKIFLEEFDKKLKTTFYYRSIKKRVSYQRLIRLECYKLIKHLIGDKRYKSLNPEW